jgi:hypothetical protein
VSRPSQREDAEPHAAAPTAEGETPPAAPAQLFAQAEALLARQLAHVQRGQIEAAYRLGLQMSGLMQNGCAAGVSPDAATAGRLRRLYDALALALTQQAAEVSEKRARLRRGRTPRRAYRRGQSDREP